MGLRSSQGQPRAEPPRSRFCLSHFRPRRTTSKPIGSKLVEGQFFATALFVCAIRLSAMADGANRLMTKIMTGFRFGAASAICAGRRSLSSRPSLYPTATTASSPAARRCGATLWNAVDGKPRRRLSKTPNVSPIRPPCGDGFGVWIPLGHRSRSCAPRCTR